MVKKTRNRLDLGFLFDRSKLALLLQKKKKQIIFKASGAPLVFELRAMGIPVQEYTPSRGNDKIARLNAVADIFASGHVWVPNTHWAEELVEEVASFPSGEHDDLVDSMSQALLRYRKGGFIRLASDEEDEVLEFKSRRNRGYYNV